MAIVRIRDVLRKVWPLSLLSVMLLNPLVRAESGVLFLQVQDGSRRPLAGVRIGVMGNGSSDISDQEGKIKLELAPQTREGTAVSLQIVPIGKGKPYVFLSPLDGRIIVPSYHNESSNFVTVLAVKQGDRLLLSNDLVVSVFAAQIGRSSASRQVATSTPQVTYATIAKRFGFNEADVQRAIADLEVRSHDSYKQGVAEMAQGNTSAAIPLLEGSLKGRKNREIEDSSETFDAANALGWARYSAGIYPASAEAFQIALKERPEEPTALEGQGLAIAGSRTDYARATQSLRAARDQAILRFGAGDRTTADYELNLAEVLTVNRDFSEAEQSIGRAESITQSVFGPHSVERSNVALYRAHLILAESMRLRPDSQYPYFMKIDDFLDKFRKIRLAQELTVEAINVQIEELLPSSPWVGAGRQILGDVLWEEQDAHGASQCYKSALKNRKANFPGSDPQSALLLNKLGGSETALGDLSPAAQTLAEADHMTMATAGFNSLSYAEVLANEALLSHFRGKNPEARVLLNRAIEISLAAEGPNSHAARDFTSWLKQVDANDVLSLAGSKNRASGFPPGSVDLQKLCPIL